MVTLINVVMLVIPAVFIYYAIGLIITFMPSKRQKYILLSTFVKDFYNQNSRLEGVKWLVSKHWGNENESLHILSHYIAYNAKIYGKRKHSTRYELVPQFSKADIKENGAVVGYLDNIRFTQLAIKENEAKQITKSVVELLTNLRPEYTKSKKVTIHA